MSRILVVDDYEDLTQVLKILLKKQGFTVDTCSKSDEIFDKIYSFAPDLIILDIFLENETGKSICMKIKNMESIRHIPVILFTAHRIPDEFLNNTMHDDFIQKPFDIDELLNKINKHLPAVSV